jgi:outer membrane protein assembly factor BamB
MDNFNFSTGDNIDSSPAVANGFVYIGSWDNSLYQLNASNISQKIANFTTGDGVSSSPAVANGFVYVGSRDNNIYQLNEWIGRQISKICLLKIRNNIRFYFPIIGIEDELKSN